MKKYLILIVTLLLITGCADKLEEKGFSKDERTYIKENLNDDEINKLLELDYDKNTINILKEDNYNIDNISKYLNYINTYNLEVKDAINYINNDIDYEVIKSMIELEDFNKDKLMDYYNIKKGHSLSDELVLYIVNNNIEYSSDIENYAKEKYFKLDNLKRYLGYNKGNNSYANVIKLVNSNRDKTFYTDSVKTDLSKGYLLIVNKYYSLDKNYVPSNLVHLTSAYTDNGCRLERKTYEQFKMLVDDAKKDGLYIKCRSGYRSYNDQNYIYNSYRNAHGQVWADKYSAKPGYSEHQTGLAIDVMASGINNYGQFSGTKEYAWMVKNAYKYGFILRYLESEENITGYSYESWHFRYVGVDVATKIKNENLTYEEYYEYYVK